MDYHVSVNFVVDSAADTATLKAQLDTVLSNWTTNGTIKPGARYVIRGRHVPEEDDFEKTF